MNNKTKELTYTGLMTAIIFIGTTIIKIPLPTGYVHLGDAFIFLTALMLNWKYAAFASAIGSALVDLTFFPIYTIPTLIIKGFMSIIIHLTCNSDRKNFKRITLLFSAIWGGILLAFTYILRRIVYNNPFDFLTDEINTTTELLDYAKTSEVLLIIFGIAIPLILILIIYFNLKKEKVNTILNYTVGFSLAGMWMVVGYYITEVIIWGNWVAPILNIPFNIIQFAVGIIIAISLLKIFKRPIKSFL